MEEECFYSRRKLKRFFRENEEKFMNKHFSLSYFKNGIEIREHKQVDKEKDTEKTPGKISSFVLKIIHANYQVKDSLL